MSLVIPYDLRNPPPRSIALVVFTLIILLGCALPTASEVENGVVRHFEAVKTEPAQLRAFLARFPKGGDLHTHLGGAIYAESYILWAADDGKCVNLSTLQLELPPCDIKSGTTPVSDIVHDSQITNKLIDSLSIRNYDRRRVSGHDQFFGTFERFQAAAIGREPSMIAEVRSRAAQQNIKYLELMQIFGMQEAMRIGRKHESFADLDSVASLLKDPEIEQLVADTIEKTDSIEQELDGILSCGSDRPRPGCDVEFRYLPTVLRGFSRPEVAAQAALAFKLVERDPRYVGLNFAMPEDMPSVLSNYQWQMALIRTLGEKLPMVGQKVTLHAGELALGLVPPEDLLFHIGQAVNVAGATRIGHGTSIAYENNVEELLDTLSRNKILIEVNLTSNRIILEVAGSAHPFDLLLESGVPIALSTDDEGVARIDLTHEYQAAVQTYDLDYWRLKELSRNSLAFSYLPGPSLFSDTSTGAVVRECRNSVPGSQSPSADCRDYLTSSVKASLQWSLEKDFAEFESSF